MHIINSFSIGGAETILANSLASGGLEEHVDNVVLFFQHGSYLLDRIDKRVVIINLRYKGWFSLFTLLYKIRKLIKFYKPDIIHTHLNPAGWYTSLIKPNDIPQVHTIHIKYSADTDTGKFRLYLERKLFLEKKCTNLIALSELLKVDLIKSINIKGKVFVLSNFIEDSFFDSSPPNVNQSRDCKLISIGNIRPQKNYSYLIEIFRKFTDHSISVDVYGQGNVKELNQICSNDSIPVKFLGPVRNPKELFNKYNAFIMASKFEGYALAPFEAMASGLPLILSNIESFKGAINENALYFNLNNAQLAAEKIREFVADKSKLDSMSLRGREFALKTVRRKNYINSLLEIYQNILDNK